MHTKFILMHTVEQGMDENSLGSYSASQSQCLMIEIELIQFDLKIV